MSIRLSLLAGVSAVLMSSFAAASDEQFPGPHPRSAAGVNVQEMKVLYVKFEALGHYFIQLDDNILKGRDKTLQALELSAYGLKMKHELNARVNPLAGSDEFLSYFEQQFLNMIPQLASLLKLEVMGDDKAYKLRLLDVVLRNMDAFVAK